MNSKLEEFKQMIRGKRVAVLGIGISNRPLIRYLGSLGVDLTAFDKAEARDLEPAIHSFKDLNIRYSLGKDYLKSLKGFDIIFKTPIVRPDIPELARERENGAVVTSEMEVFVDLCPAEIFAVTGSDGKTTTTTLIHTILKTNGYSCWLGGNIGTPLLDKIEEIRPEHKVVLELSSFQLQTMQKSPHIAVITNISPNHLDVHTSMEEYTSAKENIFRFQSASDSVVLNYENETTRRMGERARSRVVFFSRSKRLDNGVFIDNEKIICSVNGENLEIMSTEDILLPGVHNQENYLAAIAAVAGYVDPVSIRKVAATFKGVEHRIEPVREVNGVWFYNDSIGSSPSRTIASVKSFRQKVILIAGGYDKHLSYDEMGKLIAERVKCLILIGPTGPKIARSLRDETEKTGRGGDIPVIFCERFEDTVRIAYENAQPGDIVLLSPASASFDLFKNFEERGNRFKELVNELI